ncbi:hypothetical protein HFN20_04025 [Paenibacillus dendritiformis]|uniref:hypothetical protein n=1 Tax=Paenibacillus dendritiformis TaxID=130049 RepID=UPI00143DBB25|nr:hypothetical protein [Paenibacillus dendritiformis]NKI20407.1 hypothetical protein [Paenibacillus dendritiformis]NRF98834.1 hypothetical protein [Paenibacillus dendritiformis]
MADMTRKRAASSLRKKKAALWLVWIAGCLGLLAFFLLAWLPAREARAQLTEFEDVEMLERRLAAIRSQPDPMRVTAQDWAKWHRLVPPVHDESGWLQQLRMLSRDNRINVKKLRFVERRLLPAAGEQAEAVGGGAAATIPSNSEQQAAGEDVSASYGEAPSEGQAETPRQGQAAPALEAWIYELDGAGEYNDWLSWLSSLQRQERLHRLENWAIQHSYATDESRQGGGSVFNLQVIIHVYAAPGSEAWASG